MPAAHTAAPGRRPRRTGVLPAGPVAAYGVLVVLLAVCALGGGSARYEVPSLLYLRPVAVLCLGAGLALLVRGPAQSREVRAPLLFLAAFAGLMLLQLVPLPSGVWRSLPGHAQYLPAALTAQIGEPWRPLTLQPDRTINALLTLLAPAAALVAYASLDGSWRVRTLHAVIAVAAVSAVLGILQLGLGADSPAYLYRVTHEGAPVGLFANRNHQAAFLAAALPMLRVWTLLPAGNREYRNVRAGTALSLGCLFFALTITTGSRAGMALALLGGIGALLIAPPSRRTFAGRGRWWLLGGGFAVLVLVAVGVAAVGRGVAFERLADRAISEEGRVEALPVIVRLVWDYLPFGTGFGAFDSVYRVAEPDRLLAPSYMNHAHNDYLELLLDGGLPALALMIAFAVWLGRWWTAALRRTAAAVRIDDAFARLGALVTLLLLLASIVDYPLRTPLVAAVFAVACCWLRAGAKTAER